MKRKPKKPDPEMAVEQRLAQQRRYWGGRVKESLEEIDRLECELGKKRDIRAKVDHSMAAIREAKTKATISRDLCARYKWPETGPFFAGLVEGLAEAERLIEVRFKANG